VADQQSQVLPWFYKNDEWGEGPRRAKARLGSPQKKQRMWYISGAKACLGSTMADFVFPVSQGMPWLYKRFNLYLQCLNLRE